MKKITIILTALMLFLTAGCEDYLDVNKNVDAPDYVEGYLYLAGIQQAYQGIYWDIRALGPLTQMMGTNSGYSHFANHYYLEGSDAAGEVWRTVYWLQGMNLENMINQSLDLEEWTLAGIGYAMKAYSWDMMTKLHGELPLKDAFVPGLLSHRYDSQQDIYKQVQEWAHKAIELLEKTDNTNYGNKISSNDYIYSGDKAKWIKFAYALLVRNYASLSNKSNFNTEYAPKLLEAAAKSFTSSKDDAMVTVAGGSQNAPKSSYNNFWGTARANLAGAKYSSSVWFQHEYAVQVFTGTVPKYNEATGEKISIGSNPYYRFQLADKQIITDTMKTLGHYDPRVAVKLATTSDPTYNNIEKEDSIKAFRYYGSSFDKANGAIGDAPSFYGREASSAYAGNIHDGQGRWLYHDAAPYILTTYAEIKFCEAEALFKLNRKDEAFTAFKEAIKADMEFTAKHITPGKPGERGTPKKSGKATGGDKITKKVFEKLASEYLAGPYVANLSLADFSLSHIMMQKWVALYPWGAPETWVDMRKYHYDIKYSGEYPNNGNGWTGTSIAQKWDTDLSKIYKGLYLLPAQVSGRKGTYNINNEGSPCYRLRPRYNSEYMWNLKSLENLKPISGTSPKYHTSIPWFAYPNEMPTTN